MKLAAHGSFRINLYEYAEYELEHIAPFIKRLEETGPYAVLDAYLGSMLYTLDAMDYLFSKPDELSTNPDSCVGVAVLAAENAEGRQFMEPFLHKYFALRGLRANRGRLFVQAGEAIEFLANHLVSAEVREYSNPTTLPDLASASATASMKGT